MVILKISLLFFILQISLFAQWYEIVNVPHGRCDAIDAYDSLIATGPYDSNLLYLTIDGGNNWFGRPSPGKGPVDISILRENKIWFCTDDGKIYHSIDGGYNWQLQFYDTLLTKFMNYIEMFDETNGMAMGDAPASDKPALFLKTTNGGEDWISQNDSELIGLSSGNVWRRVDFANMDVGYFYTFQAYPPTIYRTTNSGKNWEVINDTIQCNVLKAYDENILLVERTNIMYRTLDGGQTWESSQYDSLGWALDIEFIPGNPSNVWCGLETLNFSSDTGRTWIKEFDFPQGAGILYDMVFTDENYGWIYAGGGGSLTNMYRTTNGGHGGIVISVDDDETNINPIGFKLEQNHPNPFNPTTKIKYSIPIVNTRHASSLQPVTLKVYDILGREIATLVNEEKPSGEYEVEFNGTNMPSGIYFYQLTAGSFVQTRKMVVIR